MTIKCKETTLNQWMLILHRSGQWLRPWRLDTQGHAIGREFDTTDLDMSRWHHFALVWDHQRGVKFYVDGKLASQQWGGHGWDTPLTPTTITFTPQHGIDELWVFDHPLQSKQIAALQQGRLIASTVQAVPQPKKTRSSRSVQRPIQSKKRVTSAKPYRGEIPRWAQQTRWLVQRFQKKLDHQNLFHFDAASPVRMLQGFHAWQQHAYGPLVDLWCWYTHCPNAQGQISLPPQPIARAREDATRYLKQLSLGGPASAMGQQALLEAWLQTGETHFLTGTLNSALTDDDAFGWSVLSTLFCRGKLHHPGWPDVNSVWATWEGLGSEVIVKINRAESQSLQVTFFNFTNQTRQVVLRPWRLGPGQYQMILGPDQNNDDMADSILQLTQWSKVVRGSSHALSLPPGASVLELVQIEAFDSPAAAVLLADPAIDASWVTYDKQTDTLRLRVINLGMASISNLRLRLQVDGQLLRLERIALLPGSNLRKLGKVEIQYPLASTLSGGRLTAELEVIGSEGSDQNNAMSISLPLKF